MGRRWRRRVVKHIAVILNHTDQVSRLEPYLLGTARPGSQIVFLVRTKARRSVWLQAQMTALSEHHSSAVQVCENRWRFELSHEKQAAERKLSALRSNLLANGVESDVRLYAGRIDKALKDLGATRKGSFAVLRPRDDWPPARLVRKLLVGFGVRRHSSMSRAHLAFSGNTAQPPLATPGDRDL